MTVKQMSKNGMRKQIARIRDMTTDKELFLSESYRTALWKLAKALGQKRDVELVIAYQENETNHAALTDGKFIYLNAANPVTVRFNSREDRVRSHEGLIAHECGHLRCSDFMRRERYVGGFIKGLVYPVPPEVETAADKRAWTEMKEYLLKGDPIAREVLKKTAAYLNNVLEDVYIENFMCLEYPGSVRLAIQRNAAAIISGIPSFTERQAAGDGELAVMMDLIFRYARAGKTEVEDEYLKKYLTCLGSCRKMIDEAVDSSDLDIRFHVSNRLMIKIWKYLKQEIRTAKRDLKDEMKNCSNEEQRKLIQDYLKEKITWITISGEACGEETGASEKIDGWDGGLDDGAEEFENQQENHVPEPASQEAGEDTLEELRRDLTLVAGAGEQRTKEEMKADVWDMAEKLSDILNEAAREQYSRQEEERLKESLKKEADNLKLEGIHKNVPIEIHRSSVISAPQRSAYNKLLPKIKKASYRLQKSVEEILTCKDGGTLSGLYMGKRLSRGNLFRQDGKIFEKKVLPEEGFSVAIAILVDESGSMCVGDRIGYAREAVQVIYDFCRSLSIPAMVYGHSTHNRLNKSGSGYEEVVDIFAYADFDSADGNDAMRMMDMRARDTNRDGAALLFAGERLLKREEDKILILISDGTPNAEDYRGETAKKDLQEIKRNLTKRGVALFAAAIGDDREQIEDIYQDGFLNISDLNAMPAKLAKLLLKYIR